MALQRGRVSEIVGARKCASYPHDRRFWRNPRGRTTEGRIAEGEHPAVVGHQPITQVTICIRWTGIKSIRTERHADDGLIQVDAAGRPEKLHLPEREYSPV